MIHIQDKSKCCGCTSCANACPRIAITMVPDYEGFLYPEINPQLCANCGLCENACPILNKQHIQEETKGYIVRYKNESIVADSTSGGAFTALATSLLERDYIVYGVGYDNEMNVAFKSAEKPEDLQEMRGSKFVQSELGTTFQDIKKHLKNGKKVLFTGTPCQVSGLISYLGKTHENLICIDFVCRGVPSPGLWKNYVRMMEEKNSSKLVAAKFKNKTYGYHTSTMKLTFENGKKYFGSGRIDPYMKAFVSEMSSRPSCSDCAFKTVERVSDITMFDCYRFTKLMHISDDDKGYSSIIIHSSKGDELFESIKKSLIYYQVNVQSLIEANGIMVCNSAKPHVRRDEFYRLVQTKPIDQVMDMISPVSIKDNIIEKSKGILQRTRIIHIARKLKKGNMEVVQKDAKDS